MMLIFGVERALSVPVWLWMPAIGLILVALAEHRWVAPRLIARRQWKRLARLRVELGIAEREEAR
jgi:hypothetical protein